MKLNSDCFTTALQVTQPLLEQFLIYGDIMGPCWLRLTKLLLPQKQNLRASTKHFLEVPKGDFIRVHPNFRQLPAPPLRVLSLAVKGVYDSHSKQEELLAISYVVDDKVDQDGGDNGSNRILYKSFIRMPENKRWPPEFQRGKNPNVEDVETENALLGAFLTKIDQIDPDVIVGHDLYSRVMGLFLNRLPKSKLTTWNRMSRL
jgi:DNA polymerase alpha subunit A